MLASGQTARIATPRGPCRIAATAPARAPDGPTASTASSSRSAPAPASSPRTHTTTSGSRLRRRRNRGSELGETAPQVGAPHRDVGRGRLSPPPLLQLSRQRRYVNRAVRRGQAVGAAGPDRQAEPHRGDVRFARQRAGRDLEAGLRRGHHLRVIARRRRRLRGEEREPADSPRDDRQRRGQQHGADERGAALARAPPAALPRQRPRTSRRPLAAPAAPRRSRSRRPAPRAQARSPSRRGPRAPASGCARHRCPPRAAAARARGGRGTDRRRSGTAPCRTTARPRGGPRRAGSTAPPAAPTRRDAGGHRRA